ncbi:MAG: permease [Candidatus Altiarchaeales archaeon]|nr:permease [Candidatus Altiarchaeales archaeon]
MIEDFAGFLVEGVLSLNPESRVGGTVAFFIADSIKIILLLYFMIAGVGWLRTYISTQKIREWMSTKTYGLSYLAASFFGVITPFCSCSSIPIFMSFIKAGVPIGPSFAFLIASPLINEYLVVLMVGFFGVRITALYVFFGVFLAIVSGVLANRLDLERYIEEDFKYRGVQEEKTYECVWERVESGLNEAKDIVSRLWIWVLLGVGIGALIHGYIPQRYIQRVLDETGVFSVPLAALIGIPIYANCSAVVPIAQVLFQKGAPLGTALAFMMATAALSLPEAVILRKVMKLPLIIVFFASIGLGIILIGYLFNFLI